jgi:hypothetical protein
MLKDREKLKQLLKDELIKELRHVYIKYDNKDLILFNDYCVKKNSDGRYEVTKKFLVEDHVQVFNHVKTAVSYVVLHKHGKGKDAKKIVLLDTCLDTLDLEIKIHTNIYRNAKDVEQKGIYLTKLQTDYIKKKQVLHELNLIINSSKQHQRNLFQKYVKPGLKDR